MKLLDISDSLIRPGRKLFTNVHNSWKYEQLTKDRWKEMCKKLGFKKVIQVDNSTDWYGCRKNTPRCFGTVVNNMPQYIFEGKWTPPCCLNALRQTGKLLIIAGISNLHLKVARSRAVLVRKLHDRILPVVQTLSSDWKIHSEVILNTCGFVVLEAISVLFN